MLSKIWSALMSALGPSGNSSPARSYRPTKLNKCTRSREENRKAWLDDAGCVADPKPCTMEDLIPPPGIEEGTSNQAMREIKQKHTMEARIPKDEGAFKQGSTHSQRRSPTYKTYTDIFRYVDGLPPRAKFAQLEKWAEEDGWDEGTEPPIPPKLPYGPHIPGVIMGEKDLQIEEKRRGL